MIGWYWAGLLTGLAANECCQFSEWAARRLVRWSAHVRYEDLERAKIRAQELEAVVADRPCQLLKLITAFCFAASAVRARTGRAVTAPPAVGVGVSGATLRITVAVATTLIASAALTIYAAGPEPAVLSGLAISAVPQPVRAASFAIAQIGAPDMYGGTGPYSAGYDDSGLVQASWAYAGVRIPRASDQQWAALPHVPPADLQPGDLLFYQYGLVAIYVGSNMMVAALQAGENVREISMSTPWFAQNLDGAARP